MSEQYDFAAGDLLMLTEGEYSDKGWSGPFKVLRPFQRRGVYETFMAQWKPADDWQERADPSDFIAWLATQGFIEDAPSKSWYLGSYGLDPVLPKEAAS